MPTKITWADETWNPVEGCTKVSAGCKHCYAERLAPRLGVDFGTITLHSERLEQPLRWRKPRRVFVCSRSDLFHEDVPDEFIAEVCAIMSLTPQHTFLVLTKRPERMRAFVGDGLTSNWIRNVAIVAAIAVRQGVLREEWHWPLPNVWLGVSVEDQATAEERIPLLLETPAAKRFVSVEPLLEEVSLLCWRYLGLDWVIVGGESGPKARPLEIGWVSMLRQECQAAGVPFYMKQASGPRPGMQGRIPDDLWRVKEMP